MSTCLWLICIYYLIGMLTFYLTGAYKGWMAGAESFTSVELKSRKLSGKLKGLIGYAALFTITIILFSVYPVFFLIRYLKGKRLIGGSKDDGSASANAGGIANEIQSKYEGITPPPATIFGNPDNPFDLKPNQVIYLEGEFNPLINDYLTNHYDRFQRILNDIQNHCQVAVEFIYLPRLAVEWSNGTENPNILKYYFPSAEPEATGKLNSGISSFKTKDFSRIILEKLNYTGEVYPGFLRIRKNRDAETKDFQYAYVKLDVASETELEKELYFYLSHIGRPGSPEFYQLVTEKHYYKNGQTYELADFRFDYEAHKLAEEVRAKVDRLVRSGGQHLLLNVLGDNFKQVVNSSTTENNGLSRLIIESDFRIILSDYNNLEIELTPLPKTVFLFFILHPEGVMLKHLCDHREELLKIYKLLSYRETWDEVVRSIDELVDPTKNSINEKCSRIKEAFMKNFEERLAQYYYITGARGVEKGIKLNRDLVCWNVDSSILPKPVMAKSQQTSKEIETQVMELYNTGKAKLSEKDYKESIDLFSQVLETNHYHFNACSMRAVAHFETGDYDQAILDNNQAIALNPAITVAYHNRAEVRLMQKHYYEALEDINKYLCHADNRCAPSYFMRGLIKMEMNDLRGACQDWFTAKHLGHADADIYMMKHPKIRIKKPLIEALTA